MPSNRQDSNEMVPICIAVIQMEAVAIGQGNAGGLPIDKYDGMIGINALGHNGSGFAKNKNF